MLPAAMWSGWSVKSVYAQLGTYVHKEKTKGDDEAICIIEFENETIEQLQQTVARELGVTLSHHKMELYGLCPECRARAGR